MRIRFLPVVLLAAACSKPAPKPVYQALAVEKRDIVVSAQASGAIQPDTTVEVKTKASGEVLQMLAETGQLVQRGDPAGPDRPAPGAERRRPVRRRSSTLAQAQLDNAKTQVDRSKTLREAPDDHAAGIRDRAARLRRAPSAARGAGAHRRREQRDPARGHRRARRRSPASSSRRAVERGQVVASATINAGGGTVLIKMADLNLVQVRTLVDETDIGKIKAGLRLRRSRWTPTRTGRSRARCSRSSPWPRSQQNVTMFPVLVRIENRRACSSPA